MTPLTGSASRIALTGGTGWRFCRSTAMPVAMRAEDFHFLRVDCAHRDSALARPCMTGHLLRIARAWGLEQKLLSYPIPRAPIATPYLQALIPAPCRPS